MVGYASPKTRRSVLIGKSICRSLFRPVDRLDVYRCACVAIHLLQFAYENCSLLSSKVYIELDGLTFCLSTITKDESTLVGDQVLNA